MFLKNKEVKKELNQNANSGQRNVIGLGSKFVGDINSDGDFRIDGTIEGTIQTNGRIVIGQSGVIIGSIICDNCEIEGTVNGKITVSELLSLKSSATVNGEVSVSKLSIESGANFDANCTMKGNVKDLNPVKEQKIEKSV